MPTRSPSDCSGGALSVKCCSDVSQMLQRVQVRARAHPLLRRRHLVGEGGGVGQHRGAATQRASQRGQNADMRDARIAAAFNRDAGAGQRGFHAGGIARANGDVVGGGQQQRGRGAGADRGRTGRALPLPPSGRRVWRPAGSGDHGAAGLRQRLAAQVGVCASPAATLVLPPSKRGDPPCFITLSPRHGCRCSPA